MNIFNDHLCCLNVKPTSAWKEVVAIFMEGDSHNSVSEIESLLYTITMMNVYVNVQHTWMVPAIQSKHDILYKGKSCGSNT